MKRFGLVVLVAALGLVVAAPATASDGKPAVAQIAKKCKKKKKHGKKKKCKKSTYVPPVVTPPAAPTPLALNDAEVINRIVQKANQYCSIDMFCTDYGYYYDDAPGEAYCFSKSTYSWSCFGWNEEYYPDDPDGLYDYECAFLEVVERSGYDGIQSHQNLDYSWNCFPVT